jgi:hypothetical protein
VVGLQEKHVDLDPVLRNSARRAAQRRGPHESRYCQGAPGRPRAERGGHRAATPLQGGHFRGELRCGPDGRYQVEVAAVDAGGAAVLANFPVYCGVAPPTTGPGAAAVKRAVVDPATAEKRMLELVNRDRAAAGLPPVTADPRLTAIARAHSRDMADHNFVGHVSRRSGSPWITWATPARPQLVLENVGRAYSVEEVEGLSREPRPPRQSWSRRRRLGVGIAFGKAVTGPTRLRTQLFTELEPDVGITPARAKSRSPAPPSSSQTASAISVSHREDRLEPRARRGRLVEGEVLARDRLGRSSADLRPGAKRWT